MFKKGSNVGESRKLHLVGFMVGTLHLLWGDYFEEQQLGGLCNTQRK
jgi:hypothetical protein